MLNDFHDYWKCYGGSNAVIKSSYFWIAVLITAISYNTWLSSGWYTLFLGTFPSLLGFSLSGYAIWLTLGDKKLKEILIKKKVNHVSAFLVINASFIHFIILQVLAFIGLFTLHTNSIAHLVKIINLKSCNLLYNLYLFGVTTFNLFIFFLCIYSILSMLAAIFGLFNIAKAMDKLQN
ncbi:hypothetical protein SKM54_09990 [Acinetobacter faecalis]|uniref:hypothetical protein n=1 Tax=Acinetobacter faecalis TaxID=2665161 RepID=UPI002A9156F5|nr:hypothetical protein [Acinetobacter faecalis]MDY6482769.1 hypothetical protein [Acinetobacter faecalis]